MTATQPKHEKSMLVLRKLFDEVVSIAEKKHGTKHWGETTLQIFWKDGEIDRLRICDDASFKPATMETA